MYEKPILRMMLYEPDRGYAQACLKRYGTDLSMNTPVREILEIKDTEDFDNIPKLSKKEVIWREDTIDDQKTIMAYHRRRRRIFITNSLGREIWLRCNGKNSINEIVEDISRETVIHKKDVVDFLVELKHVGFFEEGVS